MNLLERIFAEPELRAAPPVLVDVGAAGGIHPAWRAIAPFAIGVGFEPDARETAPLGAAQRAFKQWIFCPTLVVPEMPVDGCVPFHLTRSPQCSSTLRPQTAALQAWAFAEFFEVVETRALPAATLTEALRAQGIERIDWLKCDTQGLDLKIFLSLSAEARSRMLAVEFEPGIIDAYEGEDKLTDVFGAMAREPFSLVDLQIGRTPRRGPAAIPARWVRRFAPGEPAWANVSYLRDATRAAEALDRRGLLLAWVFAHVGGYHASAFGLAQAGAQRFGGELFAALESESTRGVRRSLRRGAPAALWRRLTRG